MKNIGLALSSIVLIALCIWAATYLSPEREAASPTRAHLEEALGTQPLAAQLATEKPNNLATSRLPKEPQQALAGTTAPWVLTVLELGGNPIPGAGVFDLDKSTKLGSTDSGGLFVLPSTKPGVRRWLVSHQGYVSKRILVNRAIEENIQIKLVPGWDLEGSLRDSEGRPSAAGVRILAFGPLQALRKTAIQALTKGVPNIQAAVTNSDGEFRLRGLDHDKSYKLFAGGQGLVAFDPFGISYDSHSPQPISITARYLYAVKIQLMDPNGAAINLNERIQGPWISHSIPEVREARATWIQSNFKYLLGIESRTNQVPHEQWLSFSLKEPRDSIQVNYTVAIPGYAQLNGSLACPRARSTVETVKLLVTPLEERRGRLSVYLQEDQGGDAILGTTPLLLELTEQGTGAILELPIPTLAKGDVLTDEVPFGIYAARILGPFHAFAVSLGDALTISHDPTSISVPTENRGALSIDVQTGSGATYSGPIVGNLASEDGHDAVFFSFNQGPYLIPLLQVGHWNASLQMQQVIVPVPPGSNAITISAGLISQSQFIVQ